MDRPRSAANILNATKKAPSYQGFIFEDQPTAMAFSLHLYSQDGRSIAGIPWALYNGFDYENDGQVEKLTILFMNRVVYVEGHNFQRAIDMMNACRLKGIGVHDSASAMLAEDDPAMGVVIAMKLDPEDFRTIVETTLSRREIIE